MLIVLRPPLEPRLGVLSWVSTSCFSGWVRRIASSANSRVVGVGVGVGIGVGIVGVGGVVRSAN